MQMGFLCSPFKGVGFTRRLQTEVSALRAMGRAGRLLQCLRISRDEGREADALSYRSVEIRRTI